MLVRTRWGWFDSRPWRPRHHLPAPKLVSLLGFSHSKKLAQQRAYSEAMKATRANLFPA